MMLKRLPFLGSASREVSTAFLDQVVVSATNFAFGLLVARALGIEGFGVFSALLLVVLFCQSVQIAVILTPMLSISPQLEGNSVNEYLSNLLIVQVLLAGVFGAAVFAVSLSGWLGDSGALVSLTAALVFFSQVFEYLRRRLFTLNRVKMVLVADVTRSALQMLPMFAFLLTHTKASVGTAIAIMIVSNALPCLFSLQRSDFRTISFSQLSAIAIRHRSMSTWLMGSALLQWLTGNYYVIVAGSTLGTTAIGALKASQNLVAITHIFFQAFENIIPRRAARARQEGGIPALRRFITRLTFGSLLLTGAVTIAFALPGEFWLTSIFGKDYAGYGITVWGYALIYMLMACGIPIRLGLQSVENTKPVFWSLVGASVFSVCSAHLMVEKLALSGVVLGMVATQIISMIIIYMGYKITMRALERKDQT